MRMPIDGTPAAMYTGIALQAARSQGLHRDPDLFFKVCPIEREIRRRVWYQLCLQDIRTAEVVGIQPNIHSSTYDTRLPINIDDVELGPNLPCISRDGFTNTTRLLIQSELLEVTRKVMGQSVGLQDNLGCHEKVRELEKARAIVLEKWLTRCDVDDPQYKALVDMTDLLIGKALFFVHHGARHSQKMHQVPVHLVDRFVLLPDLHARDFGWISMIIWAALTLGYGIECLNTQLKVSNAVLDS